MKDACLWLCLCSAMAGAQSPVVTWDFETVEGGRVVERSTNIADTIEGHVDLARGVRGQGLRLDGFTTCVVRRGQDMPPLGREFTLQAWVALGEYPLGWCPVITTESDEVKGYRLVIGPYGQVSFETAIAEQWIACTSADAAVPLRRWVHLAAVYRADQALTLFVNGVAVRSVGIAGALTYPAKTGCRLGMVATPARPSDTIRTWGTLRDYFGLDGILDEIEVYDAALTAEQVERAVAAVTVTDPDMPRRRLPTLKPHPGRFGAFYTKLAYYPGWDDLWPVDADPDIAVCFDDSPVTLFFWRGTRYGPCWVSENQNWMTDQSLETWGVGENDTEGCFEHMQDRHCRFSHVRLIENHEARAVVHWRYAPVSAYGHTWMPDPKTGWECWVDEYYTIYPDGSAVRKVSWNQGTTGRAVQYQESLPVTQPGQANADLLERDYVTVADYEGHRRAVSVDLRRQPPDWPKNNTVQQFNFKSQNKPFICFEPGNRMRVRWIDGGYNHFPVTQARCDGRWRKTLDRPAHISSSPCSSPVIHEQGRRRFWNALYGMNRMSMTELIQFGRSWAHAPVLRVGPGFVSRGYDRSQRCYQIEQRSDRPGSLAITLEGSPASPIVNPAFYVKNWNARGATLRVTGETATPCRVGIHRTLEGTDLVVFAKITGTAPLDLVIRPAP